MLVVSIALNAILLAGLIVTYVLFRRYQRRLYHREQRLQWPVKRVPLAEFDPLFRMTEHGPTRNAEVAFIGGGDGVRGGTTDAEAWVLAVLATRARRMFEFGTCSGRTAYLWARNSPPDARIATITLGPDQLEDYRSEPGDRPIAGRRALKASTFTTFLYTDTDVEHKVEQLFGDSKVFDESAFVGECDLVFIDGSHAYSYVKSDSEKAFRMLKPGGTIVWHDYDGLTGNTRGVFDYLNELREIVPLVHLNGTSLVAYRADAHLPSQPAPA